MGGPTPGLLVLSAIDKQARQASKERSSTAPASVSASRFCPVRAPALMSLAGDRDMELLTGINPFLLKLFAVMVSHHSDRNHD